MRITEGQLRRIIRESLLLEAAMRPRDAKQGGIYFEIKRWDSEVAINAFQSRVPWKRGGTPVLDELQGLGMVKFI